MEGTSARRKCPSRTPADRMPPARDSTVKIRATAASALISPNAPMMREPNDKAEADADEAPGRQRHPWILFEGTHRPEQEDRHCDREGGILRVHEHVAVVKRAGGEQHERHEPRERPAHAPADAPRDSEPENSHRRANQSAGLEQRERQKLGGERRKQVEAAAVIIEVHPRQRALVAETRGVKLEQQVAVFGVGVVVPAQAIVAKRQKREDAHDPDRRDSEPVKDTARPSFVGRRSRQWASRGPRGLGRVLLGRTSGHGLWRDLSMAVASQARADGRCASAPGGRQGDPPRSARRCYPAGACPRRSAAGAPAPFVESRPATTSSPRRTSSRRVPNSRDDP